MKYAIFESGGKQYKAVEGDFVIVDRLAVEPGSELKLDKILLLVDGDTIVVGTPTVTGTSVLATVKGHVKGPKLTVFKYRPKKRIRVKTGHRQTYTHLLIDQVGDQKSIKSSAPEKIVKTEKIEKKVKSGEKAAPVTAKKEKTSTPVKKTETTKKTSVTKKTTTPAKKTAAPAKKTSTSKKTSSPEKKTSTTKKISTSTKKSSTPVKSEKKSTAK
ncbi:MAG TPA: 50S ribosomal protein L21 [Anaerolineales bacterium]|nr:50S ribosomal protein L21 [Anaerolineales bacterium]